MTATRKPVIVRKVTRDWLAGYAAADPSAPANPAGEASLEFLDTRGRLLRIDWDQIKWLCYVRELASEGDASQQPERLLRRNFTSRPRLAGLWLRLVLEDGDELEGIAANDRSLIEGPGLLLTPPDTRSNTQRIFIPRTAIREFTILGLIAPKSHPESRKSEPTPTQSDLFTAESTTETNHELR